MPSGIIEKVGRISRRRNSLWIRIPKPMAELLELKEGEWVRIRMRGDTITVRRAKARKWNEKKLLKGITPAICGPDLLADRVGKELV